MKQKNTTKINRILPAITLAILFMITAMVPVMSAMVPGDDNEGLVTEDVYPNGYDPDSDPLVMAGYRPRYSSSDSTFIQTPSPAPDDAVFHPYGWTPMETSDARTRDAEWDHYYDGTNIDVYVDTSSSGGGSLSSNEKNLLDRIIDDFINFSWPRVKAYFDPDDIVFHVDFKIHKIDGPSGTGGYYQPGTDEFHLDRDDLSWGGVIAAHEFQHYVHRQYDINENLWVDEGCADFAAYLVYGITSAISTHIYAYLQYRPLHSIVVDDYTFYQDTTTSYYGSSFLFQLYLIEQYGGKNYTHGMVRSPLNGISGINRGLQASGTSDRFEEAFSRFMVAIRANDDYAGENGTYAYSHKSYTYGSLRLPLTRSHSSYPVTGDLNTPGVLTYSVNSIRFTSPPEPGETYLVDLTFSAGDPLAAIYYESNPPRKVEHIDFGNYRSRSIEINGWGTEFSAFQIILSSSSTAIVSYVVDILDLIPPVTGMSISPHVPDGDDGWYVTQPEITLSTKDQGDKIYYSMNGGEQKRYSEPINVPDGIWNITYHSVDRHGNMESFNFLDLKVDTQTPTTSISVDPDIPDDTWYTTPPVITINTAHPNAVPIYKFNNDEYREYTGPFTPPEGNSNLFWKSFDQAGNTEKERTRSFMVDSIAPVIDHSIDPEAPDGEDGWYVTAPRVTMSSDDQDILYYSINGGSFQTYSTPFTVPDGINEIRLVGIDQAGNKGDEIRTEVKVDTRAPEMYGTFEGWTYDDMNSSQWLDFAPSLTIQGSEEDMVIEYSIDDGEFQEYTKPLQTNEGITVINVIGRDKAGNEAPPLRYFLKIDLRAPKIEAEVLSEQVNGWYVDSDVKVKLNLVEEDENASTVKIEYSWKFDNNDRIYRGPIEVPEGSSTLYYWATDIAGNGMEAMRIEFRKDSLAPALVMDIEGLEGNSVDVGQELIVDLSSSSDENGIRFYSVDFTGSTDPDWYAGVSFTYTYTEPGTYNITAQVKDLAGNIQEKVVQIEVFPVETMDNTTSTSAGSGNDLLVIGVIFVVVLMLIMISVLVVVIVRKKNAAPSYSAGQHGQRSPHPSGDAPSNKSVSVPPPPGMRSDGR